MLVKKTRCNRSHAINKMSPEGRERNKQSNSLEDIFIFGPKQDTIYLDVYTSFVLADTKMKRGSNLWSAK